MQQNQCCRHLVGNYASKTKVEREREIEEVTLCQPGSPHIHVFMYMHTHAHMNTFMHTTFNMGKVYLCDKHMDKFCVLG